MNDNEKLELFEKFMNKELAVCESCDNTADYVPTRVICKECKRKKKKNYYDEKRKDPEWVEAQRVRERERSRNYYRERQRKKEAKKKLTAIELLAVKIMNKELTICETCDNIFPYVPQKQFCDECGLARNRKYREENHEQILAYNREYYNKHREKITARKRERYHVKKNEEE